MILFDNRIRKAFLRVKNDLFETRKSLANALFALSSEYSKLQMRVQELEKKVDELESENKVGLQNRYSYAKSY